MCRWVIRGSIVSILSSNAWQGASGFIAYATHKGGLANFVRAAAMDLAQLFCSGEQHHVG